MFSVIDISFCSYRKIKKILFYLIFIITIFIITKFQSEVYNTFKSSVKNFITHKKLKN